MQHIERPESECINMKAQKVNAPRPVVFTSQIAEKLTLAALSVVATSVAATTPGIAATATQSSPQPVSFVSQDMSFKIATGEKLAKYEARLVENLGGTNLRNRSDCTTCSGGCADDCG
jgi:hypothetical protein